MASKQSAAPAAKKPAAPAAPKTPGTAVGAAHTGGEVMSPDDIAGLTNFGGFQDLSKDDLAIPFLAILQPLSPQVQPGHAEYIEGAKAGQIFNNVTKQLYGTVLVVAADYKRSFITWVPRDKGGGFRGEAGLEAEPLFRAKFNKDTGKARLDDGNDLVDTRSFFVLTSTEATEDAAAAIAPAMVSMASTQVRTAREWMTMMNQYVPPGLKPRVDGQPYAPWAAVYSLGTVLQKNDKGSWYGWTVTRVGVNRIAMLRDAAFAFYKQIRGGAVKVDRTQESHVADAAPAGGGRDGM